MPETGRRMNDRVHARKEQTMTKRAIQMGPPPGQPPPPRLKIERAPSSAGRKELVQARWVLTEARLLGIMTHWMGSHTYPCFTEPSKCTGCMAGKDQIWKGYSVAYSPDTRYWRGGGGGPEGGWVGGRLGGPGGGPPRGGVAARAGVAPWACGGGCCRSGAPATHTTRPSALSSTWAPTLELRRAR